MRDVLERGMSNDLLQGREVIIEFQPIGQIVKVSAMDTQSLIEVSIQGPANAGQEMLKRNALKRLEYVMKKKGVIWEGNGLDFMTPMSLYIVSRVLYA